MNLEEPFWKGFNEIAASRNLSLSDLMAMIDERCELGGLSSAIRLFVLDHYRAEADARRPAEGPIENGHPVRSGRP